MKLMASGELFVVATPIGNLGDLTRRAIEILGQVDLIAAEDTRHSRHLLSHLGISVRLVSYHEHNESSQAPVLINKLESGLNIALICDAGTPLLSDPGYRLVRSVHESGLKVTPVPGACAAIAALSVAGLPTDRFVFEGFLPARSSHRIKRLQFLKHEQRTLVFYESCHRIIDCLNDMSLVLGCLREITLARELTKAYETIRKGSIEELIAFIKDDANQMKGEIVLIVKGSDEQQHSDQVEYENNMLHVLLEEVGVRIASKLAASITGKNKNDLYKRALILKEDK